MLHLFIGGSHDGERIDVGNSDRLVRVFEKLEPPPDVKYGDPYPVRKVEHYRQFDLQVKNIIFKVYAFDSLSDEHVVDMLLDGYFPMRIQHKAEIDGHFPKLHCPNDTDGDGDCHKCHRNGGCHET